ncbi:hypothetical protein FHR22_003405 [Sphingopyxis panaciterrae]|uniref:DUF2279 domain-containing protein n=1 Tax=Sphingopyxis panaciterrae TaxID=363841 RepID=UPI0014242E72|nr:DUF2279 domain-containing protein [Sphingopyxis panaciterrae]NIJ38681.1 hypothetical protein [Sphingopyxis panaciterrae]
MLKRWPDGSLILAAVACGFSTPALAHTVDGDGTLDAGGLLPQEAAAVPAPTPETGPVLVGDQNSPCCDAAAGSAEIIVSDWKLQPAADPVLLAARFDQPPHETADYSVTGALETPDSLSIPPSAATERGWADHVPGGDTGRTGFWRQAGTVKTESLLLLGYFSVASGQKLFKDTAPFHFSNEGWFGKDTHNIGVDKLAHAFNTYLMAEFFHDRIHRRTGGAEGDALTAGLIASGLMIFNELSDGIEPDSGWSPQDALMNFAGAGFSILRNTVPGLKEKVAFKMEIVPNEHVYSFSGKPHFQQQRYMFSIKGAGFRQLERSPLRFLDLQLGYYASDFLLEDRAKGIEPKRHLFVGVGLNIGELFFGKSRSGVGKAAYTVLDYLQLPYTSIRYDTTGRVGN